MRIVALYIMFLSSVLAVYSQKYMSPIDGTFTNSKPMPKSERPCSRSVEICDDGVKVTYDFDYYYVNRDNIYPETKKLQVDGFVLNFKAGEPAILRRSDSFAVPKGTSAELVLDECRFIEIPFSISPAYPLLSDNNYDEYSSKNVIPIKAYTGLFPQSPVIPCNTTSYRGTGIARFFVHPVLYDYEKSTARVYSRITYKINFKGRICTERNPKISADDNYLRNTTLNRGMFSKPGKQANDRSGSEEITKNYLIITPTALLEAANRFAEWKRMMGYNVIVSVGNFWNGNNIRQEVLAHQNLYYLLLFGDYTQIPAKHIDNTYLYSDYYYGYMGYYDQPDIYTGRLPVTTLSEANTVVDKIINYERNPVTNSAFYSKGVNCADFICMAGGFEQRRYTQTAERIAQYLENKNKTIARIYHSDTTYYHPQYWTNNPHYYGSEEEEEIPVALQTGFQWNGCADSIISHINSGAFYVLHRDHGTIGSWVQPYFTNSHLSQLNNGNLLPVVFGINCFSGKFFDTTTRCLSDLMLTMQGGGAVAVFAPVHEICSGPADALTEGMFESIWPSTGLLQTFGNPNYSGVNSEPVYTLGMILAQGLQKAEVMFCDTITGMADAAHQQKELFECFGDPSMEIRTEYPTSFSNVNVTRGSNSISVSLGSDSGRITFYDTSTGTVTAYLGSSATQACNPATTKVCIYGHNRIPYIDEPPTAYYIQNETVTGNITISADVIKAGSNVTDTKPQGPVYFNGGVINLNGGTVELNGETTVTIGTTLNINSN